MYRIALAIWLLIISSPSFAHTGHEHANPMANLDHLLWLAPLMIGVAVLFYQFNKRSTI